MSYQNESVGFLVVGAGFLGAQRAAAVHAARGTRLFAVHDADPRTASAVASRFGARAVDDLAEALDCPGVDAVVIATPHADHFPQALAALEAGKMVLCEKPLTVRPEDARFLALRADELRLRLGTGLNHRFYPPVADALELCSSWQIGRVEGVRAEIGHKASPKFLSSWHTELSRSGGGTLMDNGPHACDLIRRLLGEVVAAMGYRRESLGLPSGCEVECYALFRDFDQGFAELRSSWNQPTGYLTLEVRGSEGFLVIETAPWRLSGVLASGRQLLRTYVMERARERAFRVRHGCERSLVQEIEAFVAPQEARPRREASGWDGCRVTEMIDAVYRSDATGTEVRLEPPLSHLPSSSRRRAAGRTVRAA
ncbi:MAG: Gfo/Idh/MocA family oxidoreductase [Isosphaeraceae bacterium]